MTDSGVLPDLPRLRAERLSRLQDQMVANGTEACLLFHEANIRYATGATAMPVWSMTTFVRAVLVPAAGRPILFEHPNSVHRSGTLVDDVRPMLGWEFFDNAFARAGRWADEVLDAMRELGTTGRRLAIDRIGVPGLLALQQRGIAIDDASAVTTRAREVKTPQEIVVLERNGELVMRMLAAFEAGVAPGVTEIDLLALNASTLIRGGGEYLSTNTVCSGPNTNPWRAEATERVLEAGDLVFVDTDCVGVEGYFSCVSRTFPVGDRPSQEQRALAREAHDWLLELQASIRPGLTISELAAHAPALPERLRPQRYECMFHGIGLEEESPSLSYPEDEQSNADRVLEPGMALVAEVYAGAIGARDGVKFGDQLLVTDFGHRVLAPYPYSSQLLA